MLVRVIVVLLAIVAAGGWPARAADAPRSETFVAKGVKIHYLLAGKGTPVVLIHGLHSSAQMNWQLTGVVGELAKDYQVIALDMPGHGKSDKPENDEAYGVQLVEDVALLLDHLGLKNAHVVGYSLGGMVAAKLTTTHPDRVRSLLLGGMGWLREGSGLQQIWERMPARDGGRTPPAFIRNVGKLAIGEDDLKKVKVPVKIVVGDRDPVKRMYIEPLERVRGDWPVVEIEGAGHINCIAKEQFRSEIVQWVKRNSR